MPIIHNLNVQYGDIVYFSPEEIVHSWYSCDGLANPEYSCQYCVSHGEWRCEECWRGCSCVTECTFIEDWNFVFQKKRNDPHYEEILEILGTRGFEIPLIVGWYDNDMPPQHRDGNHRLAAAFELGFYRIPYLVTKAEIDDWYWIWSDMNQTCDRSYYAENLNEPFTLKDSHDFYSGFMA